MIKDFLELLKEKKPQIFNTLCPGASKDEIHAFEHRDGSHRHLTPALREFFSLLNGQKDKSVPFFADSFLLSLSQVDEVKAEYISTLNRLYGSSWHNFEFDTEDLEIGGSLNVVKNTLFSAHWIPFMSSQWEYYFLDFDPDKDGDVGQVILVELEEDIDQIRLSHEGFNILQFLNSYSKLISSGDSSMENLSENETLPFDVLSPGSKDERVYEYGLKDMEGSADFDREITGHFNTYLGKSHACFFDASSDITISWIKATDHRPFHILYTKGMSNYKMPVPDDIPGSDCLEYAELMVYLPSDWPIGDAEFENDNNYWPVHLLKSIALFARQNQTYVMEGDTFPNGVDASNIANTGFGCALIMPPYLFTCEEFLKLETSTGQIINFYSVIPLYKQEMELKIAKGLSALLDRFSDNNIDDIIDINRKNVALD